MTTRLLLPGCLLLAWAWAVTCVQADTLEYLERGAKLECTYRPAIKAGFNAAETACLLYFRSFMDTTGTALAATWRTNGVLDAVASNYLWVSKAGYMYKAFTNGNVRPPPSPPDDWDTWVAQVQAVGTNLLNKGYRQQALVSNEFELLRDYRMFTEMKLTQAIVLPNQLGLTPAPATGAAAPDARLLQLVCAVTNAGFAPAYATLQTEFLRAEGMAKFTTIFARFTTNAVGAVMPRAPTGGSSNGWLQLSDRPARPILLMANKPSDVFQKRCIPIAAPFFQAYRAHVDIYFVATSYHDTFSTGPEYAGADAGAMVRIPYPTTLDDHARDARHALMTAPAIAVPFLLDNEGHVFRNSYAFPGGNSWYAMVDVTGKLAYYAPLLGTQGATAFDAVMWARDIEYQLKLLMDNGGTGVTQVLPDPVQQEEINKPGSKKFVYSSFLPTDTMLCGHITAVNPAGKTFTVRRLPVDTNELFGFQSLQGAGVTRWGAALHGDTTITNWLANDSGPRQYTFVAVSNAAIAGLTNLDLFVDGLRVDLSGFSSGDFIGVKYDLRNEHLPVITAEHARVLHAPALAPVFACAFTATVTQTQSGTPVSFVATVTGTNTATIQYAWDFEHDGVIDTQGVLPVVQHSFATVGLYAVALTVSNAVDGATAFCLRNDYIHVVPESTIVGIAGLGLWRWLK
jgi:hypothetical protein